MPSYYDTEVEEQKRSGKAVNVALPILAALEAIGTSIATKGRNPTSNALGLYKDVQGARAQALERAIGRDKAKADTERDAKLLGFQEAEEGRRKSEYEREGKTRTAEAERIGAIRRKLLGAPAEMDSLGAVTKPAIPGVEGLTDLDKAAIEADPVGWLTNKLKPQGVNLFAGGDSWFTMPKTGGPATPVTTGEGATVKTPPKPTPAPVKTPEQIEAEAAARARGAASAAGAKPLSGDAAKLSGYVSTLETQANLLKNLIKEKGIRWVTMEYKKSNPAVANIIDDAADAKGRIRSGGAVNVDEEERFRRPFTGLGNVFYADNDAAIAAIDQVLAEAALVRKGMGGSPAQPGASTPTKPPQVPEGTEKINAQGVKMRMTGGKWRVAQ